MPLTLTLTSFHQACVFIECKMENRSARDSKKESGISLVWLNSLNSCTMWQWLFTRILTKRFDLYLNFPPPVKIRQIRFPFVMVKILHRICMARQTFDRILSRKTYSTMPNVLHSLPRIPKQNFEPAPSPLLAYHTSSIIRAMAQWTHPSEVYFKLPKFRLFSKTCYATSVQNFSRNYIYNNSRLEHQHLTNIQNYKIRSNDD